MREKFFAFYKLDEEIYTTIWKEGLFVLDSSFLCNLYRLPEESRSALLNIFTKIADRLWIPHHVALEFSRNRLYIISEQKKKYYEVRKILENTKKAFTNDLTKAQIKKRHPSIDSESMEKELDILIEKFVTQLSLDEDKQIDVQAINDPILDYIENIFKGKIGDPPVSQKEIDQIYSDGKIRFTKRIPPGYMDMGKAEDKQGDFYQFGGITYERQYGDLLIWKQTISECKKRNSKALMFITDDTKEDWILEVDEKKIGPRPELRDEIYGEAGIFAFQINTTEQFLSYANRYLDVKVSEATIKATKNAIENWVYLRNRVEIPESLAKETLEEVIDELANILIDSDEEVTGMLAITNASDFELETYEIIKAYYDQERQLVFDVELFLHGEHDQEKPYCGDTITVRVSGTLEKATNDRKIWDYKIASIHLRE